MGKTCAWPVRRTTDLLTGAFPAARVSPYGTDGALRPACVSVGIETVAEARDTPGTGVAAPRCHVLRHDLKWAPEHTVFVGSSEEGWCR